MEPAQPLDYEPKRAGRRPFRPATKAAVAFVLVGWFSSMILMAGIERVSAICNAIGGGIALLNLLKPGMPRVEAILNGIVLALAILGILFAA
jgi:hypothetical protein